MLIPGGVFRHPLLLLPAVKPSFDRMKRDNETRRKLRDEVDFMTPEKQNVPHSQHRLTHCDSLKAFAKHI
jgi:hypothetical protein